jgi:integrase
LATDEHGKRKVQVKTEGFCLAEAKRERVIPFREIVTDYTRYLEAHNQWGKTDRQRIRFWLDRWGDRSVQEITRQDVEQGKLALLEALRVDKTPRYRPATVNRYVAALRCCFNVAIRNGKAAQNPVVGTRFLKENNTRLKYLTPTAEAALLTALTEDHYRCMVEVAMHTGLRWSEQMGLRWRDCDFLTGTLTIPRSKHGESRHVPMNSRVRAILMDLATMRLPESDQHVFTGPEGQSPALKANRWFTQAVAMARHLLTEQGHQSEAEMLAGFTWHCLRHTFASRLAMARVDLLTIKDLGGWKTLAMVQRYAHLAPGRLRESIERLVESNGGATGTTISTEVAVESGVVSK